MSACLPTDIRCLFPTFLPSPSCVRCVRRSYHKSFPSNPVFQAGIYTSGDVTPSDSIPRSCTCGLVPFCPISTRMTKRNRNFGTTRDAALIHRQSQMGHSKEPESTISLSFCGPFLWHCPPFPDDSWPLRPGCSAGSSAPPSGSARDSPGRACWTAADRACRRWCRSHREAHS